MQYRVSEKQPNSKMCFVCGLKNDFGILAEFYETADEELIAVFKPKTEHQGYPGRLHGGIAAAVLDETIGRTVMIGKEEEIWGVTLELNIKYKKPIPLDAEIKVKAWLTYEDKRIFKGHGEIYSPDGKIAAYADGRYLRVPIEKIADFDRQENEWRKVSSPRDSEIIEI